MSVKEIAARLDISASTASRWLRGIELTPEQVAALDARNPAMNGQMTGARRLAAKARSARLQAQAHGRALAALGDPLHRAGCMLYWAEGSKGRNKVTFTNSDPDMVRFFLAFLRQCYDVDDERVTLAVNVAPRERPYARGDRSLVARGARIAGFVPAGRCRESHLELVARQATTTCTWDRAGLDRFDLHRAEHLRSSAGLRRLRTAEMARLSVS